VVKQPGISRATFLKGAAGAAAALTLPGRALAAGAGHASAASWPLPAHDISGTRHSAAAPHVLHERWAADLAGGVPGAAALTGGIAIVASLGGEVAAFAVADGNRRWRRSFGTATYGTGADVRELGFFGGVAVNSGRAVVASDRVRCLDAHTGATVWTAAPIRTELSDDYFWGPPAIVGGVVLVGSGSGAELPTARGRVTAYRLADGMRLWSTPMTPAGGEGGGVLAAPTVDRGLGLVYVGTGSSYGTPVGSAPGTCSLVALRMADGDVAWRDQVYPGDTHGFDFNSAPVLIGPRLLVLANKDGFRAWDRLTHRRLWHRRLTPSTDSSGAAGPTTGPEGGPVATDGRRVYVLSNDNDTGTCVAAALEPWTGEPIWRHRLPSFSFTANAVGGDRVFASCADGVLRVMDAATGRPVADASLGDPSTAPPTMTRLSVVVGTGAAPFLPGERLVCLGPAL
jgi:outer membrane protein assembly factor BamB